MNEGFSIILSHPMSTNTVAADMSVGVELWLDFLNKSIQHCLAY